MIFKNGVIQKGGEELLISDPDRVDLSIAVS
jgi:hypothetical protein